MEKNWQSNSGFLKIWGKSIYCTASTRKFTISKLSLSRWSIFSHHVTKN